MAQKLFYSILLVSILALPVDTLSQNSPSEISVIPLEGPFHGDEINLRDTSKWLGLVVDPSSKKSFLIEGDVEIILVKDEAVDSGEKRTGKEIKFIPKSKNEKLKPKFLIKAPNLTIGGVNSEETLGPTEFTGVGSISNFKISDNSELSIYGMADVIEQASEEYPPLPFSLKNFCLKAAVSKTDLSPPFKTTWIKENIHCEENFIPNESQFRIDWIGDLNRDNKRDFIFRFIAYNQDAIILALSDPTGAHIMLPAAIFRKSGC